MASFFPPDCEPGISDNELLVLLLLGVVVVLLEDEDASGVSSRETEGDASPADVDRNLA